jgi:hypothetical protein
VHEVGGRKINNEVSGNVCAFSEMHTCYSDIAFLMPHGRDLCPFAHITLEFLPSLRK